MKKTNYRNPIAAKNIFIVIVSKFCPPKHNKNKKKVFVDSKNVIQRNLYKHPLPLVNLDYLCK